MNYSFEFIVISFPLNCCALTIRSKFITDECIKIKILFNKILLNYKWSRYSDKDELKIRSSNIFHFQIKNKTFANTEQQLHLQIPNVTNSFSQDTNWQHFNGHPDEKVLKALLPFFGNRTFDISKLQFLLRKCKARQKQLDASMFGGFYPYSEGKMCPFQNGKKTHLLTL